MCWRSVYNVSDVAYGPMKIISGLRSNRPRYFINLIVIFRSVIEATILNSLTAVLDVTNRFHRSFDQKAFSCSTVIFSYWLESEVLLLFIRPQHIRLIQLIISNLNLFGLLFNAARSFSLVYKSWVVATMGVRIKNVLFVWGISTEVDEGNYLLKQCYPF